MDNQFEKVKNKLGFGCMRFPKKDGHIDYDELNKMIDCFMESGFNYFDTAHVYMRGESETTLKKCLTDRYPRESYVLTDKLSTYNFEKREDIRPLFEKQLEACGVDYFDFYLMHSQNTALYEKYEKCHAYEEAIALKKEGKFKHFGISFHDEACVLEKILTDHPEIEVVQLQINYLDYEDAAIQGKLCLEVCEKHGKPVIVMEPVKGGSLVNLPDEAKAVFDELGGGSYASYAIRFAAGLKNVMTVLSGMSNMEQMADNCSYMKDFRPLNDHETEAIKKVIKIFRAQNIIACTACRYCIDGCPMNISIPDLFACMNSKKIFNNWNSDFYYNSVHTFGKGKASDCIECGACESSCPQNLNIRELLKTVANEFEKKE